MNRIIRPIMLESENGKRYLLLKLLVLLICMIIQFSEAVKLDKMSLPSDYPGNATVVRYKRYLDFLPKSRMFFRSNVKANALSANQILAFSYGFRANYPIENDRKIRRRDVFDSMEEIIDHHGFDGRACIAKFICDVSNVIPSESGFFYRMYQLIFKIPNIDDGTYSQFRQSDCNSVSNNCPLNFLNLTPYMDL